MPKFRIVHDKETKELRLMMETPEGWKCIRRESTDKTSVLMNEFNKTMKGENKWSMN